MKKILLYFSGFILFVLIIGIALFSFYSFGLKPLNPDNHNQISFTINSGDRAKEITANLKNEKIIKDDLSFLVKLYLEKKQDDIQAGDYLLQPDMTVEQIIEIITSGKTTVEKLTIVEGWTLKDIANELNSMKVASSDKFSSIAGTVATEYKNEANRPKDFSKDFSFLTDKPVSAGLEGYLYPDTYYLTSKDDTESAIRKSLANFNSKLTQDLRDEIKRQGKSIYEIVILASIIEKEVKGTEDRKIVSGILQNRIKIKMAMQVDAATVYAQSKLGDNIKIDNKFESPYNTYLNRGLPIGPICNPSIDSILAAIYPEKSDYLFYLSAKDNGKTIFSKTFEEHKRAILKHL